MFSANVLQTYRLLSWIVADDMPLSATTTENYRQCHPNAPILSANTVKSCLLSTVAAAKDQLKEKLP